MAPSGHPTLFQINTRVRLSELALALGRAATLDDIPDAELDALAEAGFDIVWLLGVWQTGEAARRVSRSHPEWLAEYRRALPDLREQDVCGSCFAIRSYDVHEDFGGDAALARLRQRLRERGLRLVLDFVPNHVAPDHAWVAQHPEFFVPGTEDSLARQPRNYTRVADGRILAHGRDPYFDGWPDTLQLNYGSAALQDAMLAELQRVAARCDGVRCDMAMLVLPEVFEKTWGIETTPFWPRATQAVRARVPGFLFLAEVYWGLEWTLQQQGFDYTYDKTLYDRLGHREARPIREHFAAGLDYQGRLARFLENHDEARAAQSFELEQHRAAAILTYLSPGLRFFHQAQPEGRRVRIPMHLGRGPVETPDPEIAAFYDRLFLCLKDPAFRHGAFQLLECRSAWDGNETWDCFVAFSWSGPGEARRLVVVNYAGHASQCYVALPWPELDARSVRLQDLMSAAAYDREGADLTRKGLYLDVPAWGFHVFDVGEAP